MRPQRIVSDKLVESHVVDRQKSCLLQIWLCHAPRTCQILHSQIMQKLDHDIARISETGTGVAYARNIMIQLLHYLAVEDLARAWRVAQPNLEQTGLLRIEYAGLDELVANEALWSHPTIGGVSPAGHKTILTAILDHMRSGVILDDGALKDEQ